MTRNWIINASRTLSAAGSNTAGRRRRRGTSPCLENLEGRLSQSGIVGQHIGVALIQGAHIGVVAEIQGNHIGTSAIQGNHIGTSDVLQRKH